jgi:peptidoglycan/xylan/chitin deacetylase (PgdA/CDA1 family)
MFSINQFRGTTLPEKVLCFTFDDGPGKTQGNGPGPKTVRLAEYLGEQGVFATFFMVGELIAQDPYILSEVSGLGHLIGNHTYYHQQPLPELLKAGEDIVSEIERTNELIAQFSPDNTIYFRAPWGEWSAEVADELNAKLNGDLNHIGPFYWDIDSRDWACWQAGESAEKCADECLDQIRKVNRGIVLMHDSSADLMHARMNNLTFETVKILVPRLKAMGYSFVRLDQVPIPLGSLETDKL